MNLKLSYKKIKSYFTAFKMREIALDVTLGMVNIFSLHYDGKIVRVKRNRLNHHQRILRKLLVYVILIYNLFSILFLCFISICRKFFPIFVPFLDDDGYLTNTEYSAKLLHTFNTIKYLTTFYALTHWQNNKNKKVIITLLNDMLKMCKKLEKHIAIDFNKLPPHCNFLFHLQFLLIIGNLLNNMCMLFKVEDLLTVLMGINNDSYYATLYVMYQIVLLIQWNIHENVNANFEKRIECNAIKTKDVLKFIALLKHLKNLQNNFAKNFVWLPSVFVFKAFFTITETSFLWNYIRQHNSLAGIRLIWLYSSAALCWLDVFLLVFMLSELRRLDHYTQQLLLKVTTMQYKASSDRRDTFKELEMFLSTHHLKPYTFHLNPFLQRMSNLLSWSIFWPFVFGLFITRINPFNLSFLRSLSQ
ncbi:uncharacterized protein LOC128922791 isoform X1 [Zeugodacus cucurbitae]|uniref:uncharacterized protein LOC128922791 isoform X1 n=1 Tax=Zeugodacus cucurbitae TaxID=28588 RepID=UPI0023D90B87|nr:uncharacterized protein LOC128922791 isoform X1 [Zeugodacus cucurbitae]